MYADVNYIACNLEGEKKIEFCFGKQIKEMNKLNIRLCDH